MCSLDGRGARFVAPNKEVLASIRREMKARKLDAHDRRMPSVAASLVVEPSQRPGWNQGVFYPPTDLPQFASRSCNFSRS